jgi:hypothetical protein
MLKMMGVFAEFERAMIRERVMVGLKRAKASGAAFGRPKVDAAVEAAAKKALRAGNGIRKVTRELGIGNGTIARIKAEMTRPMDDSNPIVTWTVELEGRESDLKKWENVFRDRSTAKVMRLPGRNEAPAYFVASERFDDLQDTEVHRVASELLVLMNGTAKIWIPETRPVAERWLWFQRSDGSREPMKLVQFTTSVATEFLAGLGAVGLAGFLGPSESDRTVKAAFGDDLVKEALEHFAQPDNWFDFWKSFEVVEADMGGEAALKSLQGVIAADVNAFRANCNFHRHSQRSRRYPTILKRALTRDEGRAILRTLLEVWLRTKLR